MHRRNRSANLEVSSGREAYEIPEETAGALEEVKGRRLSEGSSPEKRRDDGGGDEDDDSGKGPGPAEGQAGEETGKFGGIFEA